MPHAGDVLVNPATGHVYRILQSGAETGGALLDMEVTFAPGSDEPPAHRHPEQEEEFELLQGSLQVRLDGVVVEMRAGDRFVVPRGVRHSMWNVSRSRTRVRWQTRPAMRTEFFFETLCALATQGRTDPKGVPGLLDLAMLLTTYRREMQITSPPQLVQRILFATLAPITRLRANRASRAPG